MSAKPVKAEKWTEERLDRLRELCAGGASAIQCAAQLKTTVGAIQNAKARYSIRKQEPVEKKPGIHEILTLPPLKFEVTYPTIGALKSSRGLRAVVYGDTHFPFQDDKALNLVKYVIKEEKPDIILHVGDLVDCWQISRWDKDPARKDDLQDNIDEARRHLAEISMIAPKSRKVLLEGNHEARLTKAIWNLDGAQREFAKLRIFQQTMNWKYLLQLEDIGWEFVPTQLQSRTSILPKIITKHGEKVNKWSGGSAKGEWEKYGHSGLSGHTHRLGQFFHQDHNGTATWTEMGCTCSLNAQYGQDFDWQQGFGVLTWSPDLKIMQTELLSIRDGATLWKGKVITG